mmetsp:Transcript_34275/g.100667  ORF Transcript_34275/g.100667 Transcript_34275/m.100667 type:complete len:223 (+) Transcript_34275:286-954(+)
MLRPQLLEQAVQRRVHLAEASVRIVVQGAKLGVWRVRPCRRRRVDVECHVERLPRSRLSGGGTAQCGGAECGGVLGMQRHMHVALQHVRQYLRQHVRAGDAAEQRERQRPRRDRVWQLVARALAIVRQAALGRVDRGLEDGEDVGVEHGWRRLLGEKRQQRPGSPWQSERARVRREATTAAWEERIETTCVCCCLARLTAKQMPSYTARHISARVVPPVMPT